MENKTLELAKELLYQLKGERVEEIQCTDLDIVLTMMNKAIDYAHSCEKLVFEEGKKMYEKGWEDGANHIYTECIPRNKN